MPRLKFSADWWAVIVAAGTILLVVTGVIARVPW